ncbi:MAG: PDZ domain-containing protein, partial [Sphingomonadales bacterium]
MMKSGFLFSILTQALLALIIFTPAQAEVTVEGDLARRAELGFEVSSSDNILAVSEIEAGSPAAVAGLFKGDNIVKINGLTYGKDFEGRDLLLRLDGDKEVILNVGREGAMAEISFTPETLPFDNPEGITILYNGFKTSDGAHLRTALSYRENLSGPLAVVALIQWVSCGIVTDTMVLELKTVMEALPVAIFRVERSSDGDSEGPACHELDYNTEILHYSEAL